MNRAGSHVCNSLLNGLVRQGDIAFRHVLDPYRHRRVRDARPAPSCEFGQRRRSAPVPPGRRCRCQDAYPGRLKLASSGEPGLLSLKPF